jgi:hypothetical protein
MTIASSSESSESKSAHCMLIVLLSRGMLLRLEEEVEEEWEEL